jgi:hypothetical protein
VSGSLEAIFGHVFMALGEIRTRTRVLGRVKRTESHHSDSYT